MDVRELRPPKTRNESPRPRSSRKKVSESGKVVNHTTLTSVFARSRERDEYGFIYTFWGV